MILFLPPPHSLFPSLTLTSFASILSNNRQQKYVYICEDTCHNMRKYTYICMVEQHHIYKHSNI